MQFLGLECIDLVIPQEVLKPVFQFALIFFLPWLQHTPLWSK